MPSAFVIILHTGYGPDHYDLMLEAGEALATWKLDGDCLGLCPGEGLAARKLPDHRLAYLNCQGPVSGGRGRVRCVHSGTYETLDRRPDRLVVRLQASGQAGIFELARLDATGQAGNNWFISRRPSHS